MINGNQDPIFVVVEGLSELKSSGLTELLFNIVTLIIAIASLILSIIVFKKKREDNEHHNNSSRKLELMKTLILEHNMPKFYEIFQHLEYCLNQLRNRDCNKQEIENELQPIFRNLNELFILPFYAVDKNLYNKMLSISDECRDKIVEGIGDEGINLYVEDKYKEKIQDNLVNAKNKIIHIIYNFQG